MIGVQVASAREEKNELTDRCCRGLRLIVTVTRSAN